MIYLDVPPAREYLEHTRDVVCPKLGCEVVCRAADPVHDDRLRVDPAQHAVGQRQRASSSSPTPHRPSRCCIQAQGLNYKPSPGGYLGQHGIYLDLVPESCGGFCNGVMAPTSLFPPTVPKRRDERDAQGRQHVLLQDVEYGYFTELGYASARLLVDLIKRTGADFDRASVLATARSLTRYDTGGFTNPARPINLTPGVEHPRDMIIVRMQGGKWVQESDWLPPGNF